MIILTGSFYNHDGFLQSYPHNQIELLDGLQDGRTGDVLQWNEERAEFTGWPNGDTFCPDIGSLRRLAAMLNNKSN